MMPIIIKDFEWSENGEWIFIVLNIKGATAGNTDVTSSPTYIKVHSPPYIFETFLKHEVDDVAGECTIDQVSGTVSFRFKKALSGLSWEQLENKELSKEEKSAQRAEAVRITHQRVEEGKAQKDKMRFDRKQATVHDQIRLDGEAKERISTIKQLESEKALADLNAGMMLASIEPADDDDPPIAPHSRFDIFGGGDGGEARLLSSKVEETVVGIRPTVCISVNFTPREFPTPLRESTHLEEQEWLKKQAEARRLCGFVDEDLRPEERNPQWLLDKGLSLMRTESYLGAISAFSLGIRLAPKMPELYVERAGAHLAVKNYHRAVEDCSQAIELLTPKVKANEQDRLKCHICRGTAFRELEMWEEALTDYKEGIRLKPENNEELTLARDEIQMALQEASKKTAEE